jgi:probable rRNA maturation factor
MIQIQVNYPKAKRKPERQLIEAAITKAVQTVLAAVTPSPEVNLTVVITDDPAIQELNHQFMGFDEPTDVLSFPSGEADPETGETYLGDIIISFPRAEAQAAQGGHLVLAELQLLTIHGTLHLLGYDHLDQEQKSAMWALQNSALKTLNNPVSVP